MKRGIFTGSHLGLDVDITTDADYGIPVPSDVRVMHMPEVHVGPMATQAPGATGSGNTLLVLGGLAAAALAGWYFFIR